ncbi:MAG: hypothetical protein JWP52_4302 [Rhizobacter sp.]|nr:hypothetical protein [Rhizobacter sp.]
MTDAEKTMGSTAMAMEAPTPAGWLAQEEYLALRKEVEACTKELATLEKVCIVSVVAVFAWLATLPEVVDPVLAAIAWLAPVLMPLYGGLKSSALRSRLALLNEHLEAIERLHLPGARGWHALLRTRRSRSSSMRANGAWALFLALTVVASVMGAYSVLGDTEPDDADADETAATASGPDVSSDFNVQAQSLAVAFQNTSAKALTPAPSRHTPFQPAVA